MLDDLHRWNLTSILAPVHVGLVAAWALIGVVGVVIIVRLRDGDFGLRVGAALFAIGGAALVLLCGAVRGASVERTPPGEPMRVVVIRSAHGKVSVSDFKDSISREGRGSEDRHR